MRKFTINQEELSFEKLNQKIREINDTIEESFSIQYLDQDGDKVTIRSTEELTNALHDQVCKLFIDFISLRPFICYGQIFLLKSPYLL